MQSTNSGDDELQEEGDTRDELCSCCSSDDELLLRSHSHFDVEAVDLAWKVAEPPSPVQRRLRRAERMYEKKKKRRENGRNSHLRKAVEGIEEDGMEDLGVDELDLLGTFLPEEW
jgi:predicted metal-dependent hydrolase